MKASIYRVSLTAAACLATLPGFAKHQSRIVSSLSAARTTKVTVTKPAAKTKAVAAMYECPDCHDKFTAAQAKKAGMKCACYQTRLVAIKAAKDSGRHHKS